MPLDFKNIKNNVRGVLTQHAALAENLRRAQEHGVKAVSHSSDYADMLKNVGSDLEYAATHLGNGGENLEEQSSHQSESGS